MDHLRGPLREVGRLRAGRFWKGGVIPSLAGELGFEPRLTESESAVLPLNYSPPNRKLHQWLGLVVLQIPCKSFANSDQRAAYMQLALFSV